jgi:wyosine [tRNA(Phe)-imidazoG37] synthetase (radical SAM superfamily)
MVHVYPVVSRRSRGLSVGINLNTNDACNWRCIYCQVPGLVRGKAPDVDLELLGRELRGFLGSVVRGDFLERCVPPESRRLNDVAFSGNGEPTSSPRFGEAVDLVARVRAELGIGPEVKTVLITNGSLVDQPAVASALERLARIQGEVWFKLDGATREAFERINSTAIDPTAHLARLRRCAALCPTWIQTCWFALDGAEPDAREREAYLDALRALARERVPVKGVLLYGIARPSYQPEAPRLSRLPAERLEAFAREIEAAGLEARVSP